MSSPRPTGIPVPTASALIWVKPIEQRVASTVQWLHDGTAQRTLAANRPGFERDQRSVDIDEDQGAVGKAGHHARTVSWAHPG